ncbi:NAD(P)/FAD-dependent oxidoreductase [Pedococcus bigeumensis]|uniref:FAD-dependent oxidoreductase n=1 Tax=Pedococcus bigeumensis TaxID=433644 RepID=A0A502CU82_9MICO|nr:FAD-binding oxidoreductase [Pedococcus bigeumensis]TPG16244.1 FAD-dependent oxidoreductase [Pedococcus bigeumensis]
MTQPLWWDQGAQEGPDAASPASGPSSPPVPHRADVVIVGGGFTGLWTAHYLLLADPSLDVLVLEAEHVGFGASGRNGGWVSALWPVGPEALARRRGRTAAMAMLAELRNTVDEVGRATESAGIGCGFRKGGSLALARSAAQVTRARAEVAHADQWGTGTRWLDAPEASERMAASQVQGATFTPHCARVHPRQLVDGLAVTVRAQGAEVVEGVRVGTIEPGRAKLADGGQVVARHVIRATEAWTPTLPGERRTVAPVYSLMVATEPLPAAQWAAIGLAEREVFSDHRHVIIYGQRTADDRLAFGGRGAPYHYRSRIEPEFDHEATVFADLRATLTDLLPQVEGVRFTHAWGGPLGIARDWHPSVGHDPSTGLGWAGGYVGDGVAATNLAGRTLADLVTGRHTPLTELPWVGHRSRRWEPEPLRWAGINAGLRLAHAADGEEARTGRPARIATLLGALTGH